MRHERFVPMEYVNQALMDDLNAFCVALKIHLHPELFVMELPKLQELQRRYGKPEIRDIDAMMTRLMRALGKDSKPMVKY